jgi:hypothetical protein
MKKNCTEIRQSRLTNVMCECQILSMKENQNDMNELNNYATPELDKRE